MNKFSALQEDDLTDIDEFLSYGKSVPSDTSLLGTLAPPDTVSAAPSSTLATKAAYAGKLQPHKPQAQNFGQAALKTIGEITAPLAKPGGAVAGGARALATGKNVFGGIKKGFEQPQAYEDWLAVGKVINPNATDVEQKGLAMALAFIVDPLNVIPGIGFVNKKRYAQMAEKAMGFFKAGKVEEAATVVEKLNPAIKAAEKAWQAQSKKYPTPRTTEEVVTRNIPAGKPPAGRGMYGGTTKAPEEELIPKTTGAVYKEPEVLGVERIPPKGLTVPDYADIEEFMRPAEKFPATSKARLRPEEIPYPEKTTGAVYKEPEVIGTPKTETQGLVKPMEFPRKPSPEPPGGGLVETVPPRPTPPPVVAKLTPEEKLTQALEGFDEQRRAIGKPSQLTETPPKVSPVAEEVVGDVENLNYRTLRSEINKSKDIEQLDFNERSYQSLQSSFDNAEQAAIEDLLRTKRAELSSQSVGKSMVETPVETPEIPPDVETKIRNQVRTFEGKNETPTIKPMPTGNFEVRTSRGITYYDRFGVKIPPQALSKKPFEVPKEPPAEKISSTYTPPREPIPSTPITLTEEEKLHIGNMTNEEFIDQIKPGTVLPDGGIINQPPAGKFTWVRYPVTGRGKVSTELKSLSNESIIKQFKDAPTEVKPPQVEGVALAKSYKIAKEQIEYKYREPFGTMDYTFPAHKVEITQLPDKDIVVYKAKSGWIVFDKSTGKAIGAKRAGVGWIGFDSKEAAVDNFIKQTVEGVTPVAEVTPPKPSSSVVDIPLSSIKTDVDRFQNRLTAYSEKTAQQIAENYNPNKFDPIVAWKDPADEKIYVLSGHSRLEGIKRWNKAKDAWGMTKPTQLQVEQVPIRFFEGTEQEAINFARLEGNRLASPETLVETLNAYKQAKTAGYTRKKMTDLFDGDVEFLDAAQHLNPKGDWVKYLSESPETFPYIKRFARWVGELRGEYGNKLTNQHERQLFDFLYKESEQAGQKVKGLNIAKQDFMDLVHSQVGTLDWNPENPLFLNKGGGSVITGTRARPDTQKLQNELDELVKSRDKAKTTEEVNAIDQRANEIRDAIGELQKNQTNIFDVLTDQKGSVPTRHLIRGVSAATGAQGGWSQDDEGKWHYNLAEGMFFSALGYGIARRFTGGPFWEPIKLDEIQRAKEAAIWKSFSPLEQDNLRALASILKEEVGLRKELNAAYTEARGPRFQVFRAAIEKDSSIQGYKNALSELKGELAPKVSPGRPILLMDPDFLMNRINHVWGTGIESAPARTAITKIFGQPLPGDSVILEPHEIEALKKLLPPNLLKQLLERKTNWEKFKLILPQVIAIPKGMMSSLDWVSGAWRQAAFKMGTKKWLEAYKNSFKYAANPEEYLERFEIFEQHPDWYMIKKMKIAFTKVQEDLLNREELVATSLPHRVPLWGQAIARSEIAHTGLLNDIRFKSAVDMLENIKRINANGKLGISYTTTPFGNTALGKKLGLRLEKFAPTKGGKLGEAIPLTDDLLKEIGRYINRTTGRGTLGGFEGAQGITYLNGLLFSPRLWASRIQLLNPAYYIRSSPIVRQALLEDLFRFTGIVGSVTALGAVAGAKVVTNLKNSDAFKIKVGNKRVDPWGGFQQNIVFAARMLSLMGRRAGIHTTFTENDVASSITGVESKLNEPGGRTAWDLVLKQFESKGNPFATFVIDWLRGANWKGMDFQLRQEVENKFVSMALQDIDDLVKSDGIKGLWWGPVPLAGITTQIYQTGPKETVSAAASVRKGVSELRKRGELEKAEALLKENAEIYKAGNIIRPFQSTISSLNKRKTVIDESRILSPSKKEELKKKIDEQIKKFTKKSEELRTRYYPTVREASQ